MRFSRLFGTKEPSEKISQIDVPDASHKPQSVIGKGRPSHQEPPNSAELYRISDRQTHEKLYIGEASDLKRRKEQHKKSGRYSPDAHNFEWKSASSNSTSFERRDSESRWIEKHQPSENRRAGGAGRRPNSETKVQAPDSQASETSTHEVPSLGQNLGFSFKRKRNR